MKNAAFLGSIFFACKKVFLKTWFIFSFSFFCIQCRVMVQVIFTLLMFSLYLSLASQGIAAESLGFGIESMRSQSYSVGIFAFMIISMLVFVGVIILFYKYTDTTKVKTGEKVLMAMIVMGVVVAAIFAAIQLLDGYLF